MMIKELKKSPLLQRYQESLHVEPSLLMEELWEGPKAALLALAQASLKVPILVISQENRYISDVSYFAQEEPLEFPSWEILPGEEILPSPDIVGKRFEVLHFLSSQSLAKPCILFTPLQALLQKLPSPSFVKENCMHIACGSSISFSALSERLLALGYVKKPVVSDKGEFAVRGGILDVFPLSAKAPFRLDFFGDTVEEIRIFDPMSQKSISKAPSIFLCPASEKEFSSALFIDYLPKNSLLVFDDLLNLEDHYLSLQKQASVSPLWTTFEDCFAACAPFKKLYWTKERAEELSEVELVERTGRAFYSGKEPLQPLTFEMLKTSLKTKRFFHPFQEIPSFFSPGENSAGATPGELLHALGRLSSTFHIHFLSSSPAEESSFKEKCIKEKISLPLHTTFSSGYLSSGFVLTDAHYILFPMTELSHRYKIRRKAYRQTYHTTASAFHELAPGDLVVHFHQGIAKYLGVEKQPNHLGVLSEFLVLEFAEKGKLYVPISQAHLVSRYIGTKEELPHLSVLGTQKWQRTKNAAQKAIVGYAEQLLRRSAERTLQGGFTFPEDSEEMRAFEEEFPFVETEDQLQAIDAVKQEMCSSKAMDRLICGDVGYGKTEVAMRAAFKAVCDGKKQVAVLVPTTVLAMQHFETFSERMANFPITIGVLSRFHTQKKNKETLKRAEEGTLDILIGTHRMISKDVRFKDLGLLIIDEEQRFGVRAKEYLKGLKVGVDCLTLSATPIPRTLYLSLIGVKEVSQINTPPHDRLPIKTLLVEKDVSLIQGALLRELSRDGQAYFIHNRVESIFLVKDEIQKLLPEARILCVHGQLDSEEIDAVFHAFKSGSADILVSTTLIENGIDIPNANTILIDRADTFGLADLYQLRGRVGRWNRPAFAYFLVPSKRELPEVARKRLHALLEASGYGGGMKIALRDLEIRGAGDILGTQQSGQVSAIGFHLYCKLLKKTIDSLRLKKAPTFIETKIEFPFDARLPEEYIGEASLRMEIYHRLGECSHLEETDEILKELKDRFGPPPEQVFWLHHLTRIRLAASQQGYTLLKLERYTLTAEKKSAGKAEKKVYPAPKSKTPSEFEKELLQKIHAE